MPVAVTTAQANKSEREERLLSALKAHILKERQRKKEEHEAEVEEERQRKEREAREQQDVMTLGETREQIQKLELKLKELNNQKQQLFLQLKKVLNEDENRKKQQQQKESEILAMHAMPPQNSPHAQVFLPPRQTHQPILQKTGGPVGITNAPTKRGRSPSPPLQQNYYKSAAYSQLPKHDDSRARANETRVLWKSPQYAPAQGALFYQTTNGPDSRPQPIIYPSYNPTLNMPLRQNYHIEMQQPPPSQAHPQKSDQPPKSAQVYHINVEQPPQPPPPSNQSSQPNSGPPPSHKSAPPPQVGIDKMQQERGAYHVEVKMDQSHPPPPHSLPDGVVYAPLMQGHPAMHPGKWEMQIPAPSQPQSAKTAGSITQGYSSRVPPGHSQPPPMQGQPPQQPPPSSQQIHYTRRLY
ncbi:basic salivary proline-rich protein 2-like [Hermetia illucens]|uniref:basic salivary proline-rich protein 2-like n=1 Tax=Hermetia illucens TaxID=343691 RepID=UPI0018CC3F86|nr:basic salivary proline-rich protein 2-like [Hermetia illucens]